MYLRQLARTLVGPPSFDEVSIVERLLAGTSGVMVDVGAHHGFALQPFACRGWEVHAFEPDPVNRGILLENHPDVHVDPRAVAEVDGEVLKFFTSTVSSGISTLSPFHDSHRATVEVETVRLDTYLEGADVSAVEFLKTDAEGFDLFALRSFPWDRIAPLAVICEFEDKKTVRLGYRMTDVADFLVARGYTVLVSEWEPIVEYGLSHQWRKIHQYPVELGPDAWGNLIATTPGIAPAAFRLARRSGRRLKVRQMLERMRRL